MEYHELTQIVCGSCATRRRRIENYYQGSWREIWAVLQFFWVADAMGYTSSHLLLKRTCFFFFSFFLPSWGGFALHFTKETGRLLIDSLNCLLYLYLYSFYHVNFSQPMTDIMINPKTSLPSLAGQVRAAIQSLESLKSDRRRSLDAFMDAHFCNLSEKNTCAAKNEAQSMLDWHSRTRHSNANSHPFSWVFWASPHLTTPPK